MKTQKQVKQYSLNTNNSRDDDEDDGYHHHSDKFLGYHEQRQQICTITIALDEEIKSPKYYRHVVDRISDLSEYDCVEFNVDTYGGSLDGIISLIHAIKRTPAHVQCNIQGVAASAGSLLALNCPNIAVAPYATLMVHSAAGGYGGTFANSAAYSNFIDKETRNLMQEAYYGFLSEEELEEVFLGRELWFNSEQIVERLERKKQYLEDSQSKQKKPERKHPNLPRDWDDN